MKRADLEHLIRAASTIADDDELIIVGSQAVQFAAYCYEKNVCGYTDLSH